MTTFAPRQTDRRLEELDELTREAWAQYSDSTAELEGREYEEAERESWTELQTTLRALDAERSELKSPASRTG
jgi:hypothetical protein